jgi:uncharacterized protein YjbI with pentapeptide repeats
MIFWGTHQERASLQGAHLQGANLMGAHLERAFLQGAHDLTVEQLFTVKTLYQGQLDPALFEQIQQRYPHLPEKPHD